MINHYLKLFLKKYFQSFTYFYKRLRYRIFVRMGLSIGVGILDGFGLAMFLPLLQLAGDASTASAKGLGNLGFIVEGMNRLGLQLNLTNTLIIMSLFFILKGCAQYINRLYEVTLRYFFIRTVRISLSNSLSRMSYKAFVMTDAGRIQNTMSGEVEKISKAYETYFTTFQQTVMVVVYMVFAFFVDSKFALLICIGGGLTNLLYRKIYAATVLSSKKLTMGANYYQSLILQFVSNFKYLKATGLIKTYNEKLISSIKFIENNNQTIGRLGAIVIAVREPILIIIVSIVIMIQVNILNGELGSILISLLFFYRALSALILMQTAYNSFLGVAGSMENMTNFEKELDHAKEKDGKVLFEQFKTQLELANASFDYAGSRILKDINLKVAKNETVAFVGESGSGKTTLVNVLCGLLPVSSGEFKIDGKDSKMINISSYQKRIGYITQEPVIFNDTIYNNVSFWADPTEANLQRFNFALQQASIDTFIDELPDRENTMLGNNGINLSGGQKQRISIARELFKGGDILVLDEATSALDSETENIIQRGFEKLQGNYTILIVAHRLSTVKSADRIVVMNKGEIKDEGKFDELVLKSSRFQKMVQLQEV